jgi:hypothetical protein
LAALALSLANKRYSRSLRLAVLTRPTVLATNAFSSRPTWFFAAATPWLAAITAETNVAINPISFGCGMAASWAVVSATTTVGSASFSSTAHFTTYSLIRRMPSSPSSCSKSWMVLASGVHSLSVNPHR